MIRLLIYIIIVLALAFGFAWLADRPGELSIVWQGQLIEMSTMVAAALLVSIFAVIMILWWFVRTLWTSPQSLRRHFRARKRDRGYQALSTGLIAAGAGDAAAARKMNARAKGLLSADQEPLIHLLEAQACIIEGRNDEARRKFEQMVEDPETRELGLRGLYLEAKRLGADEAAVQYAERAAEKSPHLAWAADATVEYKTRTGQFDDALTLLYQQRSAGAIDRKAAERKKLVLLTARATSHLDSDPKAARTDAMSALRIDPVFIPAGLIAAKALFREDNLRKGLAVLEQVWKDTPHPEVAAAYVRGKPGASAAERLKRAERLEHLQPEAHEALAAVAAAAFDARDFNLARQKAEAAARIDARESIFLLMADIEEEETGDQARVRHWLSQARRAPKDPAWVADGQVSQIWLPFSPITGRLDAFEWKKLEAAHGGLISHEPVDAEEAFASLPPITHNTVEEELTIREPEPKAEPETVIEQDSPVADQPPVIDKIFEPDVDPEPKKKKNEPVPFHGSQPDDPGVKTAASDAEPKTRLKLF
ncbi:heme biosynthesis protein HemY [Rhizobium sp. L1K21]|uniref:heme biosynthesis protein HemY n=1 Tax=Rhizobium sp. L1K21 TaxID=2954933 RepID=UPI002091EEF5|nr:heme biosynthesis protein HemY [Rhizobium sp. L1K21]MCO6184869.1 heme biosynthesis protein HemY [Rhizobium sp. L1K21]